MNKLICARMARKKTSTVVLIILLSVCESVIGAEDPDREFDDLAAKCLALGLTGFSGTAESMTLELQRLADGPLKDQPIRQGEAKGYRAFILTQLGRFDESEKLYRESMAIAEKLLPEDHPKTALLYQGLAFLYLQTGRYQDAETLFKKAVTIAEKLYSPDDPELARSFGNLSNVYIATGNYAEAERLIKQSVTIYIKRLDEKVVNIHVLYPQLGYLYVMEGRYADAQRLLERLLAASTEEYGENSPKACVARDYLGLLYRRQRRYADAERVWKESLKTMQMTNPRSAVALTELGMVYLAEMKAEQAISTFRRALAIQEKGLSKNHPDIASTLLGLAMAEIQGGRDDEALQYLDRAINIFESSGMNSKDYWECYCTRASLAWNAGHKRRALEDLSQALALSEKARTRFGGGDLQRTEAFEQYTDAFEKMVAWQTELGNLDDVLNAMERSRARSLTDQMATHGIDLLAGLTKTEAERLSGRERKTQLRVASLRKQRQMLETKFFIWPGKREEGLKQLATQLQAAQQAWVEAYADLRNASPAYRLAVSRDHKPIDLERLKRFAAEQNALILEYLLGREGGYLLIVPAEGRPRLEKLAVASEQAKVLGIEEGPLTDARLLQVFQNENDNGLLQELRKTSTHTLDTKAADGLAALYEVLIPADERKMLAEGAFNRLIICPDAALSPLPFETLVVHAGDEVQYLLDIAPPILYAPSATILTNLAERKESPVDQNTPPVLTVGDCRYNRRSQVEGENLLAQLAPRARYAEAGGRLSDLPYSRTEIVWVSQVFGDEDIPVAWLKGDMATEAIVRHNAPGRRILHFACHGLVDESYGNLFGALALTPGPNAENPNDDGFLTLAEVYGMNLKGCELAILSACDTNVGPQQRGEGVWALSRGFLVAGSRRVVASNWLVDDEAAPNFVSYFSSIIAKAEHEGKKPDYAEAVHRAKLFLRHHKNKKWNNPYYWGTFVLIGPR